MIKITVEGETLDEVKVGLAAALSGLSGAAEKPASPRGGSTAPKKDEPPADEDDDGSDGITYEEISALVVRLSKEKGRDTAVTFLKGFKSADKKPATKGAEIQPKDYPAAKEKAEALLAEEDDVS